VAAQKWYEEQRKRKGLALEFYTEFSAVLNRLVDTPLIYPEVYRGVRRAILHRFPYLVWFRVRDSVVTVLACTHGKADPGKVSAKVLKK
jgi:plasmid stabilization system protein ParE